MLVAFTGCSGRDFGGTHSGPAQGNFAEGARVVSLDAPSEPVEVHREGDAYVMTVRGCLLRGTKPHDGYVVFPDQPCDLDIPGLGRVHLTVNAHMSAHTKSPVHRIISASISLHGEDRSVSPNRSVQYIVEPAYLPDG